MSDEQGSQGPDDQSQYGGPGAPTPVAALEVSRNLRYHCLVVLKLKSATGQWHTEPRHKSVSRSGVQHSRVNSIYVSSLFPNI